MEIGIIITLIIICLLLGYTTINLLKKNEKLEDAVTNQDDFISILTSKIEESSIRLKEIDNKGSFEADDEIGWFFSTVKEIQNMLNQFNLEKENDNNDTKKTKETEKKERI